MAEPEAEETVLEPSEELLWRNVNPNWLDQGRLTSQAYRPTPKDRKHLSVAREARVSAAAHYTEFTDSFGLASAGVWAVTVEECTTVGVQVVYDENSPTRPDPCPTGHTHLDFTGLSSNRAKRIGGILRDKAEARGRLHPER